MGTGTKYLIGGAPTVGKSTIAAPLAAHLNLPWISTDRIRDIMRTVAEPPRSSEAVQSGRS